MSTTAETIIESEQGIVTGELPLTPIQHWFFAQQLPQAQHYNQALILSTRERLDPELLEQTVSHIVQHHDALRMRYSEQATGWQQVNSAGETHEIVVIKDIAALSPDEQKVAIGATANEAQMSLNLQDGPLLRIVYFTLRSEQRDRILIIIHHLVIDGVSWRIFLEDFANVYEKLRNQHAVVLPAKTTSFRQWAQKLVEYAQTPDAKQELAYWLSAAQQDILPLPVDYAQAENTVASVQTISVSLSTEETQALLQQVPQAYHTQINDILLTTLLATLTQWTGQSKLLIDLEGHGREDILEHTDISRTIGWFTSIYPLLLDAQGKTELIEMLKVVKEQLRVLPQHGIGFGLLRYLCQDQQISEQLQALPQAEISFNYLGQFDQEFSEEALLAPAYEDSGMPVSPQGSRVHQLDISGSVGGGQLHLNWTYSTNIHRPETITTLAHNYLQILQNLIACCIEEHAGGFTPSDLPLAKLSQEQIDRVLGSERAIETVYPLSPLQQGLLFHSLYTLEEGDYLVQTNFTFRGDLQIEAFQRAWQQVIERYAILRTAFVWDGLDQPQQIVHTQIELPFVMHDWRGYSPAEQQQRLTELRQQDRRQGFILSQAPLLRLTLMRITDTDYEFLWSHHHMLLDGWSMPILLKDVFICYEAFTQQQLPQLERVYPYQNYIAWLVQQDLQQAETFWRQQLKGFETPLVLGVERRKQAQAPIIKNVNKAFQPNSPPLYKSWRVPAS
ncbi:condensation domain-containing protein [Dictyobacter vulcani]|nr:condensation domain-containing protein [Dictyobacter vulcani]